MTVDKMISSVFCVDDFAKFEQDEYERYQEMAEANIIAKLNKLLFEKLFLEVLKNWGGQCVYRFLEYRVITIRLKSGRSWKVKSPVFIRQKSKKKRGRPPGRQKGSLRHLGLELLGIMKRISPALIEICVSMAVLCPSFEVAANALRGLGITMNEHLLQNITKRFARLAKNVRIECNGDAVWRKSGIKILICVDGGRIRERRTKRGKRKKDQKRQGYHSAAGHRSYILAGANLAPEGWPATG